MSNPIDNDLNLDLHFLPSWAKEPSNRNLYAEFEGEREGRPGRGRGDRPFPRREGGPPRDRPQPRPEGDRRRPEGGPRRPEFGRRPDDRGRGGPPRDFRPPKPEPLIPVNVSFRPDEKGVDSLARQIKMTGRAYPLFGVAQMILAKPERQSVTFSVMKGPEGQVLQPLFVCALDDTLWLSEQEAVNYVLDKHFATFYQAEKTAIEPPKGTYTFVAQCGMSGIILGPPNHHDYQNQVRKLHAERFSRMPFDVFRARVKIVRDEAVIKQWIESQSWRTEYTCLNMPEPLRLTSMEEVEKHFRENHLPIIVKQVETHSMTGLASRGLRSGPLLRLLRAAWEDQKRFPMQVATALSQQFAARGLQFFKVNKNITHVAVARPHYLDLELAPVSESIRRIVTFINGHPRCSRRQLIEELAPAPAIVPLVATPVPIPVEPAPSAVSSDQSSVTTEPADAAPVAEPVAPAAQPAPVAPVVSPAPASPSPEATVIIGDLHWLIHQGHVIEFADGLLETAKKPLPKPPKPPAAAAATHAGTASATPTVAEEPTTDALTVPAGESITTSPAEPATAKASPAPAPVEPAAETASVALPTAEKKPAETAPAPEAAQSEQAPPA